jgi:lipoprotein NlpD
MTSGVEGRRMITPLAAILCALLLVAGCATRRDSAPVVDRSPTSGISRSSAPTTPTRVASKPDAKDYYTVMRGDTLYSIALEHGADYREVAQWNGLDDPTRIYVGQQLRVTEPPGRAGVQVGAVRSQNRIEARPIEARPLGSEAPRSEPVAAAKPKPDATPKPDPMPTPPEPAVKAAVTASDFIWPAKGKVIAGFAQPRSKGIDIDGKPGDPIVAAAGGRVTYTGSGIPGLGKLVVIKHDNGFITVYAHNRDILVKEQQAVARGQKIAELGSTDSDRPKLHFQIRRGASPVDPMRYLPGS